MKTKVLFISHDAQPHGAQMLLLHLVRWVNETGALDAHVLLKRDGPLRKEFAAAAPTCVFDAGNPAAQLTQCRREGYDVIYSNTITNGELLEVLAAWDCPVITHVHELSYWIGHRTGPLNNAQVLAHTDHFIACSQAVADCLRDLLHIDTSQISVVHEFIPLPTPAGQMPNARERLREELGLPGDGLVVGGSGTTDWRKGADLFVQLAVQVRKRLQPQPVHFLWVGGDDTGPEASALRHDAVHAGVGEAVQFLGHKPNPRDYFALFDVMALVSREDPYPLVVLEAAALGIPTVAFERSGGAREFIEQDAGRVAPYLDVSGMADQIAQLLREPDLRRTLGQRAAQKVRERHDLGASAARIVNIIEWLNLNHRLQRLNSGTRDRHPAKETELSSPETASSARAGGGAPKPEPIICASP
jgi:glycosyltransferase involved in cell wall biosynthesis